MLMRLLLHSKAHTARIAPRKLSSVGSLRAEWPHPLPRIPRRHTLEVRCWVVAATNESVTPRGLVSGRGRVKGMKGSPDPGVDQLDNVTVTIARGHPKVSS